MFNGLNGAVYQGQPVRGDIEANLCIVEAVAKECKAKNIDICLFPELFLSGYDLSPEEFHTIALNLESDFSFLSVIAKESKCAIAVGYPELGEGGECYNSCILVDDNGNIVLNYRKTHLWDPDLVHEKIIFTAGDSLPTANLPITRLGVSIPVGILICFDCEFPEPARVLALKGIKLLLIPTAIADSALIANESNNDEAVPTASTLQTTSTAAAVGDVTPTVIVPSRAMENHLFVLYANLVGPCCLTASASKPNPRFCGQSAIIAPSGNDLRRSSRVGTGLITAQLNYSEYEATIQRNNYLCNRRPELYALMMSSVIDNASCASLEGDNNNDGRAAAETSNNNVCAVS